MDYSVLKQIIIDQKDELKLIFDREKIIDRDVLNKYSTFLKSDMLLSPYHVA